MLRKRGGVPSDNSLTRGQRHREAGPRRTQFQHRHPQPGPDAGQVGDLEINGRSGWVKVRKGKRSNQRDVPLKTEVRSALTAYLAGHPHAGDPNAHLWIGQQGPLKDRSAVLRMLNKYAFAAKMDNFGPHVLRHTFSDN
ncbi:MAG: tyrosine-type recombinase/integrase [Chloroflexota bacterium]